MDFDELTAAQVGWRQGGNVEGLVLPGFLALGRHLAALEAGKLAGFRLNELVFRAILNCLGEHGARFPDARARFVLDVRRQEDVLAGNEGAPIQAHAAADRAT